MVVFDVEPVVPLVVVRLVGLVRRYMVVELVVLDRLATLEVVGLVRLGLVVGLVGLEPLVVVRLVGLVVVGLELRLRLVVGSILLESLVVGMEAMACIFYGTQGMCRTTDI